MKHQTYFKYALVFGLTGIFLQIIGLFYDLAFRIGLCLTIYGIALGAVAIYKVIKNNPKEEEKKP